MPLQITAIRLQGGPTHRHISRLQWRREPGGETGDSPREEIVHWLERCTTNLAFAHADDTETTVTVVHPAEGPPYLRTVDDRTWRDDLLRLPRF
ncbi:DUF3892 domain-containing protein [Angustibacter aerolatus]|uniref:DUF3892 domain-containing protein n=1 Tax=Angustibacter aerolatus TaxID=1162965 RepID=A0ABQ6JLU3_9ACTN|nr:DUF3892 domain-containing protein [Angustibacter aerolatus]GMA88516.1 hypothetical protein GCM10025868_37660 [Angustibacter aerolatus]